jgi:hypothetical protein
MFFLIRAIRVIRGQPICFGLVRLSRAKPSVANEFAFVRCWRLSQTPAST